MKIRELISVSLFLSLSGGIIVGASPSFCPHDQEKRERPKFYALQVVSEKNIQNAKGSLGAPDGRCAEILPGGQLVLIMEKELYLFPATGGSPETGPSWADSGSVVGKGGADIGLEVWSPWQDTEGIYHYAWMPVGLSTTGFILPVIDIYSLSFKGNTGVNKVRITNLGTKSLFVDAVIGYGMEAKRKQEAVAFRCCTLSGGRPAGGRITP